MAWTRNAGFVGMFNGEFVGNHSDEELASIAGENFSTTNLRAELKEKLHRFEESRRTAKTI